ncbi:MAG: flavin reductase family protein [Thermoactinomyces sp.]
MQIDPGTQTKKENYKLLIGSILPRPIAFITSVSSSGVVNAAPFSFFNVIGTEPPLVGLSCIRKEDGRMKDTARNIVEQREFVVQVVSEDIVSLVNETAVDFPPEQSEAERVGFHLVPSSVIQVPRIKETKIQMECRLFQHLPLGGAKDRPNADFFIGEIVCFHLDDELYLSGRVDTETLRPVGRMAGTTYVRRGKMFSIPRLSYHEWLAQNKKSRS